MCVSVLYIIELYGKLLNFLTLSGIHVLKFSKLFIQLKLAEIDF